ncbi:CLUMA_CG003548, isoform A [Clunio marinus]|uniref:CLUMA_CG003548, isoform A n=1 Tax=Clunio marinus TaxID=568069 RepID=A0A1J1HR68_9DIPT|nr:CLUMA_CG003548, isoform A [Clunio marinus]
MKSNLSITLMKDFVFSWKSLPVIQHYHQSQVGASPKDNKKNYFKLKIFAKRLSMNLEVISVIINSWKWDKIVHTLENINDLKAALEFNLFLKLDDDNAHRFFQLADRHNCSEAFKNECFDVLKSTTTILKNLRNVKPELIKRTATKAVATKSSPNYRASGKVSDNCEQLPVVVFRRVDRPYGTI